MRPMDAPRPPRSLDDSARQPAELLDQLRSRLELLPENHPSARQRPLGAERPNEPDAPAAERAEHDGDLGRDEVAVPGPPPGEQDNAGPPPGSQAQDAADAQDAGDGGAGRDASGRDRGDLSAPDAAALGGVHLGRPTSADRYQPWFVSGEPGTPWFALEPD